jgi:hypothetical protein
VLLEELAEGGVTAGAAVAGAGDAADIAEAAKFEGLNRFNDFGFRHLQTAADDAFGATVADFVGVHRAPVEPRRWERG